MDEKAFQRILKQVASNQQPIDFCMPTPLTSELTTYLEFYHLDFEEADFHLGTVDTNGKKIMVQMHAPPDPDGTVLLLHGYFDHAGHLQHAIRYLLHQQKRVVVYDLEGHGLSGGEKLSTKRFDNYGITLQSVIDDMQHQIKGPFYAIGHSTGGAILINYLLKQPHHPFHKVVVVAPLIRSSYWKLSVAGYYFLKPFMNGIGRKYRKNSSDANYIQFVRKDPLQYNTIPFEWLHALMEWNKSMKHAEISSERLFVLQGNIDQTVDWRYNLSFLQKKFPKGEFVLIDQGKHHLFNEVGAIRREVFRQIQQIISKK